MIEDTLKERGKRYGDYTYHAITKEEMVRSLSHLPNWNAANASARQAAGMIVDKLVRAFNGDPNYKDNWHDIQGYAKLVEDRL